MGNRGGVSSFTAPSLFSLSHRGAERGERPRHSGRGAPDAVPREKKTAMEEPSNARVVASRSMQI